MAEHTEQEEGEKMTEKEAAEAAEVEAKMAEVQRTLELQTKHAFALSLLPPPSKRPAGLGAKPAVAQHGARAGAAGAAQRAAASTRQDTTCKGQFSQDSEFSQGSEWHAPRARRMGRQDAHGAARQ